MKEELKEQFSAIVELWFATFVGFLLYFFVSYFMAHIFPPSTAIFTSFLLFFTFFYTKYTIGLYYFNYSKKKEYYRIKKEDPFDPRLDELEKYFSRPNWKFYFPWQFLPAFFKGAFQKIFYGNMAAGNIYCFRLDLLLQIFLKICIKKMEEKQRFAFADLPSEIKFRFMELQTPYMKYKLTDAFLPSTVIKNPKALIVDNLELHFGEKPSFYTFWFYLRYLTRASRNTDKKLIIDMPWHKIEDIFKYFSTAFNDKFVLTFTAKINEPEDYANFLPQIIPLNSIILSSLSPDSLISTLKLCNFYAIKKLEIIESELSENDLKFLKTLKLQSLLLDLNMYESYDIIDSILEAVSGIPDIHIDILLSFFLKGYFEVAAVKWVQKYGYPKKFVFIIRILDDFDIMFS